MLFQASEGTIKFSELKIGDFFIFHYEIVGHPFYNYIPVLEKISENNYKWHKGGLFWDDRKIYKVPKINGVAYKNARVYKSVWNPETSEWLI